MRDSEERYAEEGLLTDLVPKLRLGTRWPCNSRKFGPNEIALLDKPAVAPGSQSAISFENGSNSHAVRLQRRMKVLEASQT